MTLSADLRRWALFAVWEDEAALDAFLAALARSPRAGASSAARPTRCGSRRCAAHGAWGGARPAGAGAPRRGGRARRGAGGPVAILTRATHPPAPARPVLPRDRARPPRELLGRARAARLGRRGRVARRAPGDLLPLALARRTRTAYAYGRARPSRRWSAARAPSGWYAEELFARFRPYGSAGTWDGADPLASG